MEEIYRGFHHCCSKSERDHLSKNKNLLTPNAANFPFIQKISNKKFLPQKCSTGVIN